MVSMTGVFEMKKVFFVFVLVGLVCFVGCKPEAASSKPLIGITSVYKTDESGAVWCNFAYVRAVAENGGTPIVLPTLGDEEIVRHYADILDGLVLVGGADIPPEAYGEKAHETVVVMPDERYNFESKLIPMWHETGKPMLGVCLGMQFTNVALGGNMIQDIPSQVGFEVKHREGGSYHVVKIEPASHLASILGVLEADVYSVHHQAVNDVAEGFAVVARTADGVAEAMERTDGPFGLFVQWHPEAMAEKDKAHRDAIYGALVEACVVD